MQAIKTKYLEPTNTLGARVKASCDAGSVVVPWTYEHGPYEQHMVAAKALCEKLGWSGELEGGSWAGADAEKDNASGPRLFDLRLNLLHEGGSLVDPNETLRMLATAILAEDRDQANELYGYLRDWIENGGDYVFVFLRKGE